MTRLQPVLPAPDGFLFGSHWVTSTSGRRYVSRQFVRQRVLYLPASPHHRRHLHPGTWLFSGMLHLRTSRWTCLRRPAHGRHRLQRGGPHAHIAARATLPVAWLATMCRSWKRQLWAAHGGFRHARKAAGTDVTAFALAARVARYCSSGGRCGGRTPTPRYILRRLGRERAIQQLATTATAATPTKHPPPTTVRREARG
jgi:hypothetical protein